MAGAGSVTASVTATGTVSVTGLILPSTASSCETTALISRPGTWDAQGCAPSRAETFDAYGNRNSVPGHVRWHSPGSALRPPRHPWNRGRQGGRSPSLTRAPEAPPGTDGGMDGHASGESE